MDGWFLGKYFVSIAVVLGIMLLFGCPKQKKRTAKMQVAPNVKTLEIQLSFIDTKTGVKYSKANLIPSRDYFIEIGSESKGFVQLYEYNSGASLYAISEIVEVLPNTPQKRVKAKDPKERDFVFYTYSPANTAGNARGGGSGPVYFARSRTREDLDALRNYKESTGDIAAIIAVSLKVDREVGS